MQKKTIYLKDRLYSTCNCCFVMGVVNATEDSFYEKSRIIKTKAATEKILKMMEQGADIIDLGAESSRPGADYVSAQIEIERLVPIIEEVRKYDKNIPISVDTRKKSVMEQCFFAGADILNDISALEDDPQMADFVAKTKIPVILMHKRGIPCEMQKNTDYSDVIEEVTSYLYSRADYAVSKGIEKNKIIFDVGIGFGKDLKSNLQLVRNCVRITKGYEKGENLSLLALSRKTMIGQLTGKDVEDRLAGTLAAYSYAILNGCDIVRVHDVDKTVDVVKVLTELINE
ncbi:MAG: dihydropteroate synthase [Treponemataceae bacterium]